jgi:hypothetical protein
MKLGMTGHIAKATLFAVVLLAVGLLGSRASAQAVPQWKFALAYEVHWGQATLPPGDYLLTFEHLTMRQPTTVVIREAKSFRVVATELVGNREDSTQGASALLITTQGKLQVVESLRIAELGETFVYERSPARQRKTEEARRLRTVPALAAEK